MKNYQIRRASIEDKEAIMLFIGRFWAANHILAVNKTIFEWQYRNGDFLNFIVAYENNTDNILAILGFIHYGEQLSEDIMLALWKSAASVNPFLGVELLEYLENMVGRKKISCNGINLKTTKLLYEFMGYRIDYLKHYYRLSGRDHYQIASIKNNYVIPCTEKNKFKLIPIDTFQKLEDLFIYDNYEKEKTVPKKSRTYIEHRYYQHPIYQYQVYGIKNTSDEVNSLLFMRSISCNGGKVLRIVDFIGKVHDLNFISYEIDALLKDGEYEYVDFLQNGISNEIMEAAGFLINGENTGNIIPNYFEPYECSNVKLWFATKYEQDFIIFKADGDQDRPNRC